MYLSLTNWIQLITALLLLIVSPGGVSSPVNVSAVDHPYVCACGTESVIPAYTEDEFEVCADCRTGAYAYEDGTYSVLTYDEYGGMASMTDYDAEGGVLFTQRIETEYDEHGNALHALEYYDDVLSYESVYLPCEDPENGDFYLSEWTLFDESGKYVYIYDEQSYLITCTAYGADDSITGVQEYSYEFDADGNVIRESCTENGILRSETFYSPDSEGYFYASRSVAYDEEGRPESAVDYDEYGEIVAETSCDAEGNPAAE